MSLQIALQGTGGASPHRGADRPERGTQEQSDSNPVDSINCDGRHPSPCALPPGCDPSQSTAAQNPHSVDQTIRPGADWGTDEARQEEGMFRLDADSGRQGLVSFLLGISALSL